jgi:DNA-binding NarL/FixJ family response regulator
MGSVTGQTPVEGLRVPLGRVVAAAPHQPTRVALARTLTASGGVEALSVVGSYRAVAGYCARSRTDVVLLALHAVAPGVALVGELAAVVSELGVLPRPPEVIVVVARPPGSGLVGSLAAAGIAGLLVWPYPSPEPGLTVRQHQLLAAVAGGHSTAAIAARLGIGAESVKTELRWLYRKLGATGRATACARAFHTGLLT